MNMLLNTHINREGSVDSVPMHHQSGSIKYEDHDCDGAETKLEEGDTTWIPPEEHDDDDDDINWESEPSPSPREAERQTAMLKAINGQLKMLVTRFLASAAISLPQQGHDGGESWLDIITSLSWEAALLIKPHATVGKQMDPASYIKVKRVASGTRRQCEVIEGLVFKKNVAHKHMPTKCHNPKLLLLRGALGDSDIGLSSFDSMEQDKDHMEKVISQVMEICSPDVIMVEKTVSRDILEHLLKEGVTLVLDVKLHQLERIARCSGSPIISFSDVLSRPKLKQCDYFRIEKFVEEHNHTAEAGKMSSKTLMFLEGFLKPLGCTILLRGASSEELRKVKQVMHYTVFAAYHLVLETSFFEDQRVFLNNTVSSAYPDALNSPADSFQNELPEEGAIIHYDSNHTLPFEKLISSVPGSLRGFIDIFHHQNIYLPVTSSQETIDHQEGGRLETSQEIPSKSFHVRTKVEEPVDSVENITDLSDLKEHISIEANQQRRTDDDSISGEHEQLSVPPENVVHHDSSCFNEEKAPDIDDTYDVLDSQSILILMSSQCITNQVFCEQSHLSRIKYYGNFDVSLGRYLQDILQNQNISCSSCGEPPEAHVYSYTHRDGNLTVLVKRLPPRHCLPGESEGKIWMWTRCLRCEHESGIYKSSRRVLLSTEARNLSFGKFLELTFSSHSAARKLSICGHLVSRDCLRFFGLGSLVAMFQYSSVEIYTACTPQPTLEFHNSDTSELFEQERRNVLARGVTLFSEVASLLQHIKNQSPEVAINYGALFPVKEFSQLEEMLIKEKDDFVDSLVKAFDQRGMPSSSVHELLDVNWLYQDLLLELYMWDRRLHQLVMCECAEKGTSSEVSLEKGSIEAVQVSEVGMNGHAPTLVDSNPRDEEQHSAEPPDSLDVPDDRILTRSMPIKREPIGISEWVGRERWVWSPLYESKLAYRQEVEVGCLEKFELVNHYLPSHLPPLHLDKQSAEDVCSPRFIVGPGGDVLCVAEDEISSIISCALAISDDRRHLLYDIVESEAADTSCGLSSEASSSWSSIGSSDSEASFSSDDLCSYDSSLSSPSLHPGIPVNGRVTLKGKYSVICVHANQFYTLRKKCCPSELAYITSLSRCKKWDAQGGKSKAFFAKTMDGRFIIKQIKKTEFESSIEFAPDYFKHVYHSLDTGSPTCLAKILGIYQVKQIRHGKEVKTDLMVMENLLFGHNVSRTYDLKGAIYSRYVTDSSDRDTVYLDQNFVEDMRVSPIYIGARTKHLLQRAIWNDTSFLTSINVMDYSLLVGVDKENREFVFGIIDYLRQYTWDKQLETWAKASLVVPKNVLPTIISPREYKKRFRKFMAKYFLTVPDDWSTTNRPGSCKSCAHSNCKLPEVNNEKPQHQIKACA